MPAAKIKVNAFYNYFVDFLLIKEKKVIRRNGDITTL
jgi:hypothetical protein